MSTHNLKKRKRVEVNKPQVTLNQENQRAAHLQSDSCRLVVTPSSSVSTNQTNKPSGANKRLCVNATGAVLGSPSKDVANKQENVSTKKREEIAAKNRAEALKMALARISELQDELLGLSDDSDDESGTDWSPETPEMIGYAVCVQETLAFLAAQGLDGDNPMIVNLKNSLVEAMPL